MNTGERIEEKNNRNQSSPAVVAPFPISFTQTGCVALELLFFMVGAANFSFSGLAPRLIEAPPNHS
jgi:hypothetical protein